ncbi:hypothetical protein [Cohnella boryungensis]|uniref:YqzL family protein n=1 Tax=Cohnella boryungensis TaxID=768479 RepID=A0ABV8S7Q5_9BACL
MGLLYKIYQSVQQGSEEYQAQREDLVEHPQKENGSEPSFTLAELLKHPIGRTSAGRE